MQSFFILTLIMGCERTEQKSNTAPTVQITAPTEGESLVEGQSVLLTGVVQDQETASDSIIVQWRSSTQELCPEATPNAEGSTECEVVIGLDDTQFFLEATDEEGTTTEETVSITVVPSQNPQVHIIHPLFQERYHSDTAIAFEASVSDNEDAPEALTAQWSSSIDGELSGLPTAPTDEGLLSGEVVLSEGEHTISLTIEDTTGKATTAEESIVVLPPNNTPLCTITSPATGYVGIYGDTVELMAEFSDADSIDSSLNIAWSSDKDGVLETVESTETTTHTLSTQDLSVNDHTISIQVTDGLEAVCINSIELTIGTPPVVSISSPSTSDIFNEGDEISFAATVSDGEDLPTDLTIDWSINGTSHSTTSADSTGASSFTDSSLSFDAYTLVVTVTDTDGLSSSEQVDFTVNGIPSSPTISITPTNPTTESSLTATIDADSIDPDGQAISYSYEWFLGGTVQGAYTTETLPSSATSQGQEWSVQVTPTDGITTGAFGTAAAIIENTAPVLSNLTISPTSAAYNDNSLTCSASVTDPDETLTIEYTWTDGNNTLTTGSSIDLSNHTINPTDVLTCTASVHDSAGASATESTTKTIENRSPTVDSISIDDTMPYADSTMTCSATVSDADGESLLPAYEWSISGNVVGSADALTPTIASVGDTITCTATVEDGYGGSDSTTATATLQNTSPTMGSVSIAPSSATVTTELTCSAVGTDINDGNLNPVYLWTNDTTNATLGSDATLQLDSTISSPDDGITCLVTFTDNNGASVSDTSTITIENTPPVFDAEASISPSSNVYTNTALTCSSTASDADDGSLSPTYTWMVGSTTVSTSATYTISASDTDVGDVVTCTATAIDSDGESIDSTAEVNVINTPPVIHSVAIEQSEIYTNDTISVLVDHTDADMTNDATVQIDWYVTDADTGQESLVQSSDSDVLDGQQHFDKGDVIRVDATVSDASSSVAQSSSLVTVMDAPPTISTITITPDPAYAEFDDLTCTVAASDDDGDSLQYEYTWSSASGTTYTSSASASVSDTLDSTLVTGEEWTCSVTASDGANDTTDSAIANVEPSACDGVSCGPGGTCNNLGSTYTCTCRDGFEGTNCELDIDECATNNGDCTGTRSDCINTMGGHYCIDASTVLSYPETTDTSAETYYNVAVITVNGRDAFPTDRNDYYYSPSATYFQTWYDQDELGDIIFDNPDGIKSFFSEISYGKANFQGVVVDWYDDYSTTKTSMDIFFDHDDYIEAAYDKIDPTQYDIFMVVGLADSGTTQIGWGMQNSVPDEFGGRLYDKGLTYLINSAFHNTAGVNRFGGWVLPSVPWVHELFHTIGIFGHSNTLWCYPNLSDFQNATTPEELYDNSTVALSNTCDIKGYGDPFSLMGERLWATHPSVASKLEMDWIDEDFKTEIDANTSFLEEVVPLYPHNTATHSNNVALQILVPEFEVSLTNGNVITMNRITVETRAVEGFDTYLSALGTGYRPFGNIVNWYFEFTYSWSYQHSAGIYELNNPIDTSGALVYLDNANDSNEAVYLIDGNPASAGVLTDASSPKGHKGNAGKFANAMIPVGGTLSSDLLPFTLSIETGPDGGVNGDVYVRVTPVP